MPAISNEVLIAAIGAFTTIVTAFLAFLTIKVQQVKKLVDGTATLLAAQTQKDTERALEVTERRVEAAGSGAIATNTKAIEELKKTTEQGSEVAKNTAEIAEHTSEIAENTKETSSKQ